MLTTILFKIATLFKSPGQSRTSLPFSSLPGRFALIVMLLGTGTTLPLLHAQEYSLGGEWRGTYNINIGGDREIIFTITHEGDTLSAVFDNPAMGMMSVTAESVQINGRDIRISLPRIQGEYYGTIHSEPGPDGRPVRIDGDWSQAGEYVPITLLRTIND